MPVKTRPSRDTLTWMSSGRGSLFATVHVHSRGGRAWYVQPSGRRVGSMSVRGPLGSKLEATRRVLREYHAASTREGLDAPNAAARSMCGGASAAHGAHIAACDAARTNAHGE